MGSKVEAWDSTPLVNVAMNNSTAQDRLRYLDEVMAMHKELRPPVGSLKQRLGKQSYTWDGEYRFWIWEGENWRGFASNKQGVSFEVRCGLSKVQAFAAWDDFRKKAGLK